VDWHCSPNAASNYFWPHFCLASFLLSTVFLLMHTIFHHPRGQMHHFRGFKSRSITGKCFWIKILWRWIMQFLQPTIMTRRTTKRETLATTIILIMWFSWDSLSMATIPKVFKTNHMRTHTYLLYLYFLLYMYCIGFKYAYEIHHHIRWSFEGLICSSNLVIYWLCRYGILFQWFMCTFTHTTFL
jgi:hypothetical protein